MMFAVVAVLTECFEVIPREGGVRIVYVLARQICSVMRDGRYVYIAVCFAPLAQIAFALQK